MAQVATSAAHAGSPASNRLLAALPSDEYGWLRPRLEPVRLLQRQVLWEPAARIAYVYFPLTAVLSQLTLLSGGEAIETGLIGREGMAGVPVFLGPEHDTNQMVCQVAGTALRLPGPGLHEALANADGRLGAVLRRYVQLFLAEMAQTSACGRAHSLAERCARWLLRVDACVPGDSFRLTHEFLGDMLGARRPSVTLVAATLQEAGLIRYQRGTITILDRSRLEAAACECHAAVVAATERMLGPPARSGR